MIKLILIVLFVAIIVVGVIRYDGESDSFSWIPAPKLKVIDFVAAVLITPLILIVAACALGLGAIGLFGD